MPHEYPPSRLDLKVFPAETTGRFVMFILSAVLLTWQMSFILVAAINPFNTFERMVSVAQKITLAVEEVVPGDADPLNLTNEQLARLSQAHLSLHLDTVGLGFSFFLVPLLVTAVVLVGAFVIYRTHPTWLPALPTQPLRLRRGHTFTSAPAPPVSDAPRVTAFVQAHAQQGGFPAPTIQFEPTLSLTGQAFGVGRQSYLRLWGYPRLWEWQFDPRNQQGKGEAQCILLHELGHVAHRDASWIIFTTAIWIICGVFAVLLTAGYTLFALTASHPTTLVVGLSSGEIGGIQAALGTLWLQVFITLLVVRGMWGGLHRIREFYADHWAVVADERGIVPQYLQHRAALEADGQQQHPEFPTPAGHPPPAMTLQASEVSNSPYSPRYARLHTPVTYLRQLSAQWARHPYSARLRRLWSLHPTFQERFTALSAPGYLFRIASDLPFLTGILLAMLLVGLPFFTISLLLPLSQSMELLLWGLLSLMARTDHPSSHTLYLGILVIKLLLPLLIGGVLLFGIALLIVRTLGIQIQRETVIDLVEHTQSFTRYFALLKVAGWLVIGLEMGFMFTPFTIYIPSTPVAWALTLGWMIGSIFLTWLWLFYARMLTRLTIGTHGGTTPPHLSSRITNLFLSFCLVALYTPLLFTLFALVTASRLPSLGIGAMPFLADGTAGFSLLLLLLFAYVVYFGAAALSLLVLGLRLVVQVPHCWACKEITSHRVAVGHRCEWCGSQLAPWVFVGNTP